MAEYLCATRSSYFHVNDEKAFHDFMTTVSAGDDTIKIFCDTNTAGDPVFAFGAYDQIQGIFDENDPNKEDLDKAWNNFTEGLQKHLMPDDACIIMEAGHEKLRYVVSHTTIITKTQVLNTNMVTYAKNQARSMLHNPNWDGICEY